MKKTMAQALVEFLKVQHVARDGRQQPFFAGCFGIFGHGNVAGVGEALQENPDFRYYQARNEQSMVHSAIGFAKMSNRMRTLACTSSIGPGATNMVTGAATATINRLPVLLLPGDIFANRKVAPVLQQLEAPWSHDVSVNDCFRPVSTYWDRINRPDQLVPALMEAMRVLTSPASTGAVTLSLPQDVQTEAYDYPDRLFQPRVWDIPRARPDADLLQRGSRLAACKRASAHHCRWRRPIQRGVGHAAGLRRSDRDSGFGDQSRQRRVAVRPSAGAGGRRVLGRHGCQPRGARRRLGHWHRHALHRLHHRFQDAVPESGWSASSTSTWPSWTPTSTLPFRCRVTPRSCWRNWPRPPPATESPRLSVPRWTLAAPSGSPKPTGRRPPPTPSRCGKATSLASSTSSRGLRMWWSALQAACPATCTSSGAPSSRVASHLEYGYSCMGYEIAGGIGAKLAAPEREVYVMVGDGSYLMMAQELVTALQEGIKINVVLLDNHGWGSIRALSTDAGADGWGTQYRYRNGASGLLDGDTIPLDLAANAEGLGMNVIRANTADDLHEALGDAREADRSTLIAVDVDAVDGVPTYESWWDVPISEVSTIEGVNASRERYAKAVANERPLI